MSPKITRIKPRPGGKEEPWEYERGYQLADPRLGANWHFAENAIFTRSIEKAADLIEHRGFAIRMGRRGLRPSLIRPSGLHILR
jgi:hypothetical protein